MKLNWNFLGNRGIGDAKQKPLVKGGGGGYGYFMEPAHMNP